MLFLKHACHNTWGHAVKVSTAISQMSFAACSYAVQEAHCEARCLILCLYLGTARVQVTHLGPSVSPHDPLTCNSNLVQHKVALNSHHNLALPLLSGHCSVLHAKFYFFSLVCINFTMFSMLIEQFY